MGAHYIKTNIVSTVDGIQLNYYDQQREDILNFIISSIKYKIPTYFKDIFQYITINCRNMWMKCIF